MDSNIFIHHLADDPRFGTPAGTILRRVEEGEPAVTSTFVIAQVCGYLASRGRADAVPIFLAGIRGLGALAKEPTLPEDFWRIATLRNDLKLSWREWDDMLIVAQLRRLGLSELYSHDPDFDRFPGIKRLDK